MLKYFSFEMSDTAVSGECGEKKKKKKNVMCHQLKQDITLSKVIS